MQEEDRDEGRAEGDDEEREARFEGPLLGLRHYRQCHPWVGEEILALASSYVLSWRGPCMYHSRRRGYIQSPRRANLLGLNVSLRST